MAITARQELRLMERALKAAVQMDASGQEFVAAWLLNTTQTELERRGLFVRAKGKEIWGQAS